MYARVVRFTDADPERIEAVAKRIEENDGPPDGVVSTGMKLIYDSDQKSAVFVGFFDTEEDMKQSAAVLEAMDAGDTPGTRASIDQGEVKVEAEA